MCVCVEKGIELHCCTWELPLAQSVLKGARTEKVMGQGKREPLLRTEDREECGLHVEEVYTRTGDQCGREREEVLWSEEEIQLRENTHIELVY